MERLGTCLVYGVDCASIIENAQRFKSGNSLGAEEKPSARRKRSFSEMMDRLSPSSVLLMGDPATYRCIKPDYPVALMGEKPE